MKELSSKLVFLLTITMLISAWGIWWIMLTYFFEFLYKAYPIIPVSVYLMGLFLVYVLYTIDKSNPRKLVNIFMLLKILKIVLFAALAVYLMVFLKLNRTTIIINLSTYYLIYLLFETLTFYVFEKQIKNLNS
jgi:hypothetical protein